MKPDKEPGYTRLLRTVGLELVFKGIFYWPTLIGIMYAYANRGVIDGKFWIFLIADIYAMAIIILGIYFSEIGLGPNKKPGGHRVLTFRRDIPRKVVIWLMLVELLLTGLVLVGIPELPKLWIFIIMETWLLVWSIRK